MHSSRNAMCARVSRPTFKRANHFSFPPTQRMGLLDPTTHVRSTDQQVNLQRSHRSLLSALNVAPMQHNTL